MREIFMRDWDPIGVADIEGAEDEYECYIVKAYVMLMDEGATADALESYLYDIAINRMGLSPSEYQRKAARKTAETLIAVRSEFEEL